MAKEKELLEMLDNKLWDKNDKFEIVDHFIGLFVNRFEEQVVFPYSDYENVLSLIDYDLGSINLILSNIDDTLKELIQVLKEK